MKTIKENENLLIPEFFQKTDKIFIPNKTHKSINFIEDKYLLDIHSNIKIAKELCLLFLSYMTRTMLDIDEYSNGINLSSKLLANLLRSPKSKQHTLDTKVYQAIIKALEIGTKDKGAFIIVNKSYVPGEYSRKYNLTDNYKSGIQIYSIKTKWVKDIVCRNTMVSWIKANTNLIAKNMIMFYTQLDLPTKAELLIKGKQLCNENYTTKKGKKLTMLYRKDKSYWKDSDNRSFVENDIDMFEYYTSLGFMIPVIGNENCPRVYDSISLLPSWIRNEIKCFNEKIFEVDYKCLHPNLIMNLYNEPIKYLTHEIVANELELDIKKVKTMHLSFFNMEIKHLTRSPLMKYYSMTLMEKIINDKKIHKTHKITSKYLFDLEVQIMTKVIKKLNKLNIYVGYIYDALITTLDNIEIVKRIMDETVLEFKVFTTADSNEPKKENNTNILETKVSPLKAIKTISTNKYKEFIETYYPNIYIHIIYKRNEDRILNELYLLQTKNKQKIEKIIKKYYENNRN